VVADEVRSLSKRTQDSTQEIAQIVDNLQCVVGQSVTLMEEACSQADGDIGSVLVMGDELQNIVDSVQRVSDRLAQIATAAEQQGPPPMRSVAISSRSIRPPDNCSMAPRP